MKHRALPAAFIRAARVSRRNGKLTRTRSRTRLTG
jgi:hypothetical protein